MKPNVLVVWPNRPKAMAELEQAYQVHHLWRAENPDELFAEVAPSIRAVVASGERGPTAQMIEAMPKLEIVATFGVGVDATDREACKRRNIPITTPPDVLTEEVADMGLALMLCVLRRIVQGDRWVMNDNWGRASVSRAKVVAPGQFRVWGDRAETRLWPGDERPSPAPRSAGVGRRPITCP